VIFVIAEVLRGLGHAHDLPVVEDHMLQGSQTLRSMKGIVHRDVSPHNVLLSWEGAVKVSDFGIAKARSASQATASEFIKGKPAYMSPEQANGDQLDGRSDLFAVGVMMWELLVGRRLFVGQDTRTTLAAVLFGQIPRPRSMRSDVPKDVVKVVMKLLERELPARYATAEAAIRDLLACSAAPRDGRELLKSALAERFPQHAPIRHSVLRSRGGSPPAGYPQQGQAGPQQPGHPAAAQSPSAPTQPGYLHAHGAALPPHLQPTQQPAHAVQTIADGAIGRPQPTPQPAVGAQSMPSLGAIRGAQTGTLPHHVQPAARPLPPGGNRGRRAIGIAAVVAGAGIAFAIVMTVSRGKQSTGAKTPIIAQGSAAAAAVPTDAAVPVDAPAVDAPIDAVAAAPIDARTGDAKKDATVARPSEKKGMGRLVVKAFPVLTVFVDSRRVRDTPIDIQLPAGKHKLRLVNSEGKSEVLTVTIEENKPTVIEKN
jgi:serine/threonine-protein kinase